MTNHRRGLSTWRLCSRPQSALAVTSAFDRLRILARPRQWDIPDYIHRRLSSYVQLDFSAGSVGTAAMILTPEMCRAARALLRWKSHQLAGAAGLGTATIRRFESGGTIRLSSVEALFEALKGAGLEFIPAGGKSLVGGPGLRTIPLAEPEVAAAEQALEMEDSAPSETMEFNP